MKEQHRPPIVRPVRGVPQPSAIRQRKFVISANRHGDDRFAEGSFSNRINAPKSTCDKECVSEIASRISSPRPPRPAQAIAALKRIIPYAKDRNAGPMPSSAPLSPRGLRQRSEPPRLARGTGGQPSLVGRSRKQGSPDERHVAQMPLGVQTTAADFETPLEDLRVRCQVRRPTIR